MPRRPRASHYHICTNDTNANDANSDHFNSNNTNSHDSPSYHSSSHYSNPNDYSSHSNPNDSNAHYARPNNTNSHYSPPTMPTPATPAPATPAPTTPPPITPAPSTPVPSTPAPTTAAPTSPPKNLFAAIGENGDEIWHLENMEIGQCYQSWTNFVGMGVTWSLDWQALGPKGTTVRFYRQNSCTSAGDYDEYPADTPGSVSETSEYQTFIVLGPTGSITSGNPVTWCTRTVT